MESNAKRNRSRSKPIEANRSQSRFYCACLCASRSFRSSERSIDRWPQAELVAQLRLVSISRHDQLIWPRNFALSNRKRIRASTRLASQFVWSSCRRLLFAVRCLGLGLVGFGFGFGWTFGRGLKRDPRTTRTTRLDSTRLPFGADAPIVGMRDQLVAFAFGLQFGLASSYM